MENEIISLLEILLTIIHDQYMLIFIPYVFRCCFITVGIMQYIRSCLLLSLRATGKMWTVDLQPIQWVKCRSPCGQESLTLTLTLAILFKSNMLSPIYYCTFYQ